MSDVEENNFEGRANPDPNTCLGVFGLSLYTTERDLREVFSRYGPLTGVNVVYDQRTGRSRGFAFVYFERIDDSKEAMEHANGMELDGRRIRVDYSITKRAHTPTPGIYMGRPTHSGGGGGGGAGRRRDSYYDRGYDRGYDRYEEYDYRYRRRSPSPYYSRYRSRSRSRSYSPNTEGETFVKTGRCTNGLEKAMSHFSGSVAEFPEEVRDHLTQNDFLTFVAETEATFLISNGSVEADA
ncbi:Transformer-2 protein alpha [Turdus rufiventris]|nr:Transformer-2 protein alpha [Turdus rufiventris]